MARTRIPRLTIPLSEFWNYVERTETCWIWKGRTRADGYGRLGNNNRAHRVAFELCHGPFPEHLHVLHHCDNPPCVRPDHLFLGTDADNMRDKIAKGRQRWGSANGESNGNATMTIEQVLAIRASIGLSKYALARKYGVTRRTIYDILTRATWKHI